MRGAPTKKTYYLRHLPVFLCLLLLSGWNPTGLAEITGDDGLADTQETVSQEETEANESPTANETSKEKIDPYAEWATWSEDPIKKECRSDDECVPDRTGRETYCRKRKGALEGDPGYCRPYWLNRKRQAIQMRNQRIIVDAVCKPPSWWTPDVQCWKFKWRTAKTCNRKHYCDPDKLSRFLRIPAKRESTWDHQTDHRLDPDRIANRNSYKRMYRRGVYKGNPHFYEGLTLGKSGKPLFRLKDLEFHCDPDNPYDQNCDGVPDRWSVGYGWYGMNAALFTWRWDPMAPPEVLAKRVPATLTILRAMRKAWRKFEGGVDCRDADGNLYTVEGMFSGEQKRDYKKDTWPEQTWWSLHRAVFGGMSAPSRSKAISGIVRDSSPGPRTRKLISIQMRKLLCRCSGNRCRGINSGNLCLQSRRNSSPCGRKKPKDRKKKSRETMLLP